jgi:hypothetical protein
MERPLLISSPFYLHRGQIQDMLLASLMEMEFMHRQEELEHLQLERALTLSVAVEEERLRLLMAEAKLAEYAADEYSYDSSAQPAGRDANYGSDAKVRTLLCQI